MFSELLRLKRTYRRLNRLRQIVSVFLRHGFRGFIDQLHLQKYLPFRERFKFIFGTPELSYSIPERLRLAFSELGPSFIKLAQLLASRPDIVTIPYANEFKKLQDEVPPFSFEEVLRIIEGGMRDVPAGELFDSIDETPVAAASIAQVHFATLKDSTPVMIKVQRPNITDIIETDISILKTIASHMVKYIPETEVFNLTGIVEEFSRTIRKELDFIEEVKNIQRFSVNFRGHPHIYIPMVFTEYTTKKFIVMERIKGVRIDDIEGIEQLGLNRSELARIGVDAYLKMFLEDGFFHGDPHPGNIFVMLDGRVALVDFGIVGWLAPEIRGSFAEALIALVRKDFDVLVEQHISLGLVTEEVDVEVFKREFKADLMDFLLPLYDRTISEINITQYIDTMVHVALKHHLKIPSELLLLNKCMLILDNIGRQLDPDFNFVSVAEPYATKLVRGKYSPNRLYDRMKKQIGGIVDLTRTTPKQLQRLLRKTLKDDLHIKMTHIGFDRLIRDIDRSTNRLALSIVITAIMLSSALLTLSEKGESILEIPLLSLIGFLIAFVLGLGLLISIIRSGRL